MSKLQTQNWMAKQIFLDIGMVPNDAPWLEIIDFRATTWIHALDSEQSSKNCIFRDTIFKKLQQPDEARFPLVLCYKVLFFETRKHSQSLQVILTKSCRFRMAIWFCPKGAVWVDAGGRALRTMVSNDAPWLEIICFRATTWIHALDSEQSSENCIFRDTIFKKLQQPDEAWFSLLLCYKVLLFETRKNYESLQATVANLYQR